MDQSYTTPTGRPSIRHSGQSPVLERPWFSPSNSRSLELVSAAERTYLFTAHTYRLPTCSVKEPINQRDLGQAGRSLKSPFNLRFRPQGSSMSILPPDIIGASFRNQKRKVMVPTQWLDSATGRFWPVQMTISILLPRLTLMYSRSVYGVLW